MLIKLFDFRLSQRLYFISHEVTSSKNISFGRSIHVPPSVLSLWCIIALFWLLQVAIIIPKSIILSILFSLDLPYVLAFIFSIFSCRDTSSAKPLNSTISFIISVVDILFHKQSMLCRRNYELHLRQSFFSLPFRISTGSLDSHCTLHFYFKCFYFFKSSMTIANSTKSLGMTISPFHWLIQC